MKCKHEDGWVIEHVYGALEEGGGIETFYVRVTCNKQECLEERDAIVDISDLRLMEVIKDGKSR